jgi:hypothetical protein
MADLVRGHRGEHLVEAPGQIGEIKVTVRVDEHCAAS